MGRAEYIDRLKEDYEKTFDTDSGKHVLNDLYLHCGGATSSFSPQGNSETTAFNEGRRWVWLRIMGQMQSTDMQARAMLAEHTAERQREGIV